MSNRIQNGSTLIVVQSCDHDWANVGVFVNVGNMHAQKVLYRRLDVPALTVKPDQEWRHTELPESDFERIIGENASELRRMIQQLNLQ